MHGPPIQYNNESVKRGKSSRKLLRNGTLKPRNLERSFECFWQPERESAVGPWCVETLGGGEEEEVKECVCKNLKAVILCNFKVSSRCSKRVDFAGSRCSLAGTEDRWAACFPRRRHGVVSATSSIHENSRRSGAQASIMTFPRHQVR
ncbi:hypothetical protein E2C01_044997 [Portunus trituberculatus]|uniref:Uncharacterized protein n=1 Tax=Portunus trituberculatus TaxID=210409 RepID=A0A5B7G0M0_PORTR|nr:hypothetical protein [Portunus trituberculatus]